MLRRGAAGLLRVVRYFLRFCAFLVLLAAALVAAGGLMVKVLLTPESLKAILTDQLQEALHRPVQIRDVNFLLTQGIRVQGLRVLEAPGTPAAVQGDFIVSDVLLAKYDWRALLFKRLKINELLLVSPRIQIIRFPDGRWSVEDIFVSTAAARGKDAVSSAASGPLKLPVSLAADVVAVDQGTMAVRDLKAGRDYSIQKFDLRVRKFDPGRPFAFHAAFDNSERIRGAVVRTRASLDGSASLADFRAEDASASISGMRLEVDGRPFFLSANLKGFAHPRLDLRVKTPALPAEYLARFGPGVPSGLQVPAGLWRAVMAWPSPYEFRLESLEMAAEPLKLRAKGFMRRQGEAAAPYLFEAALASFPLSSAPRFWRDASRYGLEGTVSANAVFAGDLLSRAEKFQVRGLNVVAAGAGGAFPPNHRIAGLDAELSGSDNMREVSLSVSRGSAVLYGNALSKLDLQANVSRGSLDLKRLNLMWGSSHMKFKGRMQGMDPPVAISLDGSVDKLKLGEAVDSISRIVAQVRPAAQAPSRGPWARIFRYSVPKTFPTLSGRLRVGDVEYPNFQGLNLDCSWNLRGISTGLGRLGGAVRASFGPGRVFDIPALEKDNRVLRVVFLPFVFMHRLNNMTVISLNTAYPKTLDYDRIYGEYGLSRGQVNVKSFFVRSQPLLAYADGVVDFPGESVNLHILTRLNAARGSLPEYLTDQKGRPSIGFFVEGNLNQPTIRIDYRKMKADEIDNAIARSGH